MAAQTPYLSRLFELQKLLQAQRPEDIEASWEDLLNYLFEDCPMGSELSVLLDINMDLSIATGQERTTDLKQYAFWKINVAPEFELLMGSSLGENSPFTPNPSGEPLP